MNCPNWGSVRTTGEENVVELSEQGQVRTNGEEPRVELSELGVSSDKWRRTKS
ncbi:hypothetical protein [Evansella tamaricis]|uniref:hypothetical protein n=1 Tax=Evansella tamaricis TaxID=2069301 RepID=UPI0036D35BB4